MENKILNKEEVRKKGLFIMNFDKDTYSYEDKKGIWHLIRNGKLLCEGEHVYLYSNGNYEYTYEDENKIQHLIRNGEELCSGKNIKVYGDGSYEYKDEKDKLHRFTRKGERI